MSEDTTETAKQEAPATTAETMTMREYFFPIHGKTISATSQAEAESKLAELLKEPTKK